MKPLAAVLAALLMVIAVCGRVAAQSPLPKSTIIQKIIVKVNGEIFTQTELEFQQIQKLKEQNRAVASAQDLTTDKGLIAALAPITPEARQAAGAARA